MKHFTIPAFLLIAVPLIAGVRITSEVVTLPDNKTTTQEILIDSTRMRVNMGAETSVLFLTDGGRNRMVMLDKRRNEYREMDQQTMDSLGQQMQGMMAQMEEQMKNMPPQQREMMERMMKGKMPQMSPGRGSQRAKTEWARKGRSSVNGFECTQHDGMRNGEKMAEVCAAPASALKLSAADVQIFEKMREFTSGLQDALARMPMTAGLIDGGVTDSGFEGFPVQRISFRNGQPSEKQEVKSAAPANFSDTDFSLGNARKVDMPTGPR